MQAVQATGKGKGGVTCSARCTQLLNHRGALDVPTAGVSCRQPRNRDSSTDGTTQRADSCAHSTQRLTSLPPAAAAAAAASSRCSQSALSTPRSSFRFIASAMPCSPGAANASSRVNGPACCPCQQHLCCPQCMPPHAHLGKLRTGVIGHLHE